MGVSPLEGDLSHIRATLGQCMGKTQWCQTRDRPAHSRLWGENRTWEEGKRGGRQTGCWWRWFSKKKLVTTTLRTMNGKEFKTFPNFVKLIKMAAAVAKAQEKNRVPESPQVLWLFLSQGHRGNSPTEPSSRDWSATILSLSRTW